MPHPADIVQPYDGSNAWCTSFIEAADGDPLGRLDDAR
jgi:hypothetical protein